MDLAQFLREQAIAGHDEEDPGLAEQQDQDDRRKREDRTIAEQIADGAEADRPQDMRQRFLRADQSVGILRQRALAGQFFRSGGEGNAARPHDRLATDGADRAGRDEDVDDRAE